MAISLSSYLDNSSDVSFLDALGYLLILPEDWVLDEDLLKHSHFLLELAKVDLVHELCVYVATLSVLLQQILFNHKVLGSEVTADNI